MRLNPRPRLVLAAIGFLASTLPLSAIAQTTSSNSVPAGRIVGRVIDSRTGQGLSEVGIQVVGTMSGAASGLDGRFTLTEVTPGTVTMGAEL